MGVCDTPLPSAEDRSLLSDNRNLLSDDRSLRRKIPSLGIFLRSLRLLKFSREFTLLQPPLVQGQLPQKGEVPAVYDQTVGVRGVRGVRCFFKLYMCRLVRLFAWFSAGKKHSLACSLPDLYVKKGKSFGGSRNNAYLRRVR